MKEIFDVSQRIQVVLVVLAKVSARKKMGQYLTDNAGLNNGRSLLCFMRCASDWVIANGQIATILF